MWHDNICAHLSHLKVFSQQLTDSCCQEKSHEAINYYPNGEVAQLVMMNEGKLCVLAVSGGTEGGTGTGSRRAGGQRGDESHHRDVCV